MRSAVLLLCSVLCSVATSHEPAADCAFLLMSASAAAAVATKDRLDFLTDIVPRKRAASEVVASLESA